MTLSTWQDWVAWAGVVVPLSALAWAAGFYVINRRSELKERDFQRVFDVMDHLGRPGGSVASKMAAAFELRKFKDYAPVIVRLCDGAIIDGDSAKMLRSELDLTANEMRKYL